MTSPSSSDPSQVRFDWLDTYAPASLPYMIGFSIFVPFILGANIGLEFWLAKPAYWALTVQQGLLNAGTMSTWGIPLTIILTEWITRMLARHFIARREKAASDRYTKVQRDLDAQQKDLDAQQKDLHIQREDLDVQQKDAYPKGRPGCPAERPGCSEGRPGEFSSNAVGLVRGSFGEMGRG